MLGMDPAVTWLIRLALALLFAVSAWHKLRDLHAFRATLANYRLLPPGLSALLAPGLAICELAIAALLLIPAARIDGAAIAPIGALVLLALYSGALAINLARGRRDLDCGCLGPAHRQPVSPGLLLRNALLATGAALLLLPVAARNLSWIDALTVAGGWAMLVVFWNAAHRLATGAATRLNPGSAT
jgi:uncharacterized membrane protein YphA (DoxX/SURF4 family)